MKKLLSLSFAGLMLLACSDNKSTEPAEQGPVSPGADNVNGNIPDSSDALQLNKMQPRDSSALKDTTGD